MIEVQQIEKNYQSVSALKNIEFGVEKGKLFGMIGPDGAGKTTLIRILTSLLLPDKGSAHVMGLNVVDDFRKLRKNIGYMPGRFSLYEDLSVLENLSLFASIFGTTIRENYHLIEDIYKQIEPFKNRKAGALSGGMKQKLALSCAMIHAPRVIFLDEPTTGVDPVSRKEFWHMLGNLKDQGITMLVSTPYMDEASQCDEVALIQEGSILSIDKPQGIIKGFGKSIYDIKTDNISSKIGKLREMDWVYNAYLFGESVRVVTEPDLPIETASESLSAIGIGRDSIFEADPGIEDCFIELMGRANSQQ